MTTKRITATAIAGLTLAAGAATAIGLANSERSAPAQPAEIALDEVRSPGGVASLPSELRPADGQAAPAGVSVALAGETVTAWAYTARSGRPMMATLEEGAGLSIGGCDATRSVVRPCSGSTGPGTLRWFGTSQAAVASIEARMPDGRTVAAALRDGVWVLDLSDGGAAIPAAPVAIVARDAAGVEVAGDDTAALRDLLADSVTDAPGILPGVE